MSTGALARSPRAQAIIGVGLASAAAWTGLAALGYGAAPAGWQELAERCLSPAIADWDLLAPAAAMWLLMSVAMMLPTALPAIGLYAGFARRMEASRAGLVALFASGYVAAWGAFGALAATLQIAAASAGLAAAAPPGVAAGTLLLLAGLYQLTPLKAACLALCRNPMAFFLAHWRDGPRGALTMGLRHGLVCIGCCWALMGLMLLAGAMNLLWMAGLGLLMLAEKTLPLADRAGRGAGIALALAGAALLLDHIL